MLNCAARVIIGGDRRDHATPLLRDKPHWLRAKERITFKLYLLVCSDQRPCAVLSAGVVRICYSYFHPRPLRSAACGNLVVPCTRRRFGNRTFSVADGPTAWNSLSPDSRTAPSLTSFKNLIKTLLIQSYYSTYL